MFQKLRTKLATCAALLMASIVAAPAFATPPDVTAVVAAIGDTLVPIGLIGSAVLLVIVGFKVYKWVRRAM